MAKLRKFIAYRRLERPYTRISKYRKKSFVRARPASKIIKYVMGDSNKRFLYSVNIVSKDSFQIRHNALESARQSSNRLLEKQLGKNGYMLRINPYAHHILRENPIAAGAGADRMSTGMKKSFGKPVGTAVQLRTGQRLATISVDKAGLETAKKAAKRIVHKVPNSFKIEVAENKAAEARASS